jgi:6-phosphogluconolactonase
VTAVNRLAVYVSHAESGDIAVFSLDPESGELALLQQVPVGGAVMPMAISPDRRFLFAARRTAPLEVLSYAIAPESGALGLIGASPLPGNMAWISTDRSGRFLISASYGEDFVAINAIDPNGVVAGVCEVLRTGRHAHSAQTDLSNRYLFAAILGEGVVMQRRFDAATGTTQANLPPVFASRPGAGPRHFVFHPHGAYVYVLNELDATVDVFELAAAQGILSHIQTVGSMPPAFEGAPWAADVRISSDGRFVYTSERRSSTLAAFAVDPSTGRLSSVGHVNGPEQPRSFAIAPGNRYLIAAGQKDHRLGVYQIDAHSGELRHVQNHSVGKGPTWVEAVQLPDL